MDEPNVTAGYLATRREKNLARSVPFSRMIAARGTKDRDAHQEAAAFAAK